jgi:hypothetical protein
MAKRLFEQAQITLNGVDIGADVHAAEVLVGRRAPVDVTGLADTYDQFLVPNIRNWAVRLSFFNNFSSSGAIASCLKGVYDSTATSGVTFTLRATTNNRSFTNPEWSGQVQLDGEFPVTAGDVAEADRGSVSLKGLSTLSWFTCSS